MTQGFISPSRYLVQCATKCMLPANGVSNGTDTGQNSRVRHQMLANVGAGGLRFVYCNVKLTATGEADGDNDIVVAASCEPVAGTYVQAFFNGASSITIKPGGYAITDPIGVDIAPGAFFWSKTYVTATGTWPLTRGTGASSTGGEGCSSSNGEASKLAATQANFTAGCYAPCAILGTVSDYVPTVGIISDSIDDAQSYDSTPGDGTGNYGVCARALKNYVGVIKLARVSYQASFVVASGSRIWSLVDRANLSTIICGLGVNDVTAGRTLAQIKADLMAIWTAADRRGIAVFQKTITPVTTSSDTWKTVANQTPHATNGIRTALNDYIRTGPVLPSGRSVGVLDVADIVETSRNSGVWHGDENFGVQTKLFTEDGTHPAKVTGPNGIGNGFIVQGAAIDYTRMV